LPSDCGADFPVVGGGNPNLKPEKSRQANAGIVLEPFERLSIGADYYWVHIERYLSTVTEAAALSTYNVRQPPDPQFPNLPGPIDHLLKTEFNVGSLETSGVDVDARWRIDTEIGRWSLSLTGTYVLTYEPHFQCNGNEPASAGRRGDCGGAISRWRHYATIDFTRGPWGFTAAQAFQDGYSEVDFRTCVPPGSFPTPANCPGDRRVGSSSLVDLQLRYGGVPRLSLAGGVRNLFDRDPPRSNQPGTAVAGVDAFYADVRGRTWYASLRYAFR